MGHVLHLHDTSLLLAYAHANKHCVADPGNWNETGNGTLHVRLCLGAESEFNIRNALLIGIYESCSFTGVIYVIGSSYKPGEMTCRVALFFVSTWDYVCGLHAGCCLYGFQWEAWIVWVEVLDSNYIWKTSCYWPVGRWSFVIFIIIHNSYLHCVSHILRRGH